MRVPARGTRQEGSGAPSVNSEYRLGDLSDAQAHSAIEHSEMLRALLQEVIKQAIEVGGLGEDPPLRAIAASVKMSIA